MTELTITTIAERPHLAQRLHEIGEDWPIYMDKDRFANSLFHWVAATFPEYCVVATDPADTLVAHGCAVPFAADVDGRDLYPDGGWERVVYWGFTDHSMGRKPTVVSGIEMVINPAYRGHGLAVVMVTALRDTARKLGYDTFVGPVRPTGKQNKPSMSTMEYARRTRDDGLPEDPWLRVHVRAGATIAKVARASTVSGGSLEQWRAWTGLPFDRDGEVEVPEALVPVVCNLTHDYAVYVEPNIWVHHDLTT